jgi:hypothetical protein
MEKDKELFNARQRDWRAKNNNASTKKYEKTHKGFLMRLYRNMKSRVTGVQHEKFHLYEGKSLLPKDDFYNWALESDEFFHLFMAYTDSGFDRKFAPSVDRKDSSKGYSIDNMEWVTHSENSRRGGKVKMTVL